MTFSCFPRPSRLAWALALCAVLAGCSSPPPTTFDLTAAPSARGLGRHGLLVVAEPVAVALLDSDRIVVRTGQGSVAYLSGAQWADRLPKLVQSRLIQSFENARQVGMVGRPGDRLVAAAQLNTELRSFEVLEKSGEAVVEVTARLVNDRTGRINAAQIFTARVPASAISGPAGARALDQAMQSVMGQIVVWASRRG